MLHRPPFLGGPLADARAFESETAPRAPEFVGRAEDESLRDELVSVPYGENQHDTRQGCLPLSRKKAPSRRGLDRPSIERTSP